MANVHTRLCIILVLLGMSITQSLQARHKKSKVPPTLLEKVSTHVHDASSAQLALETSGICIAALALAFGFKALYQFVTLAHAQYIFRNENTNTDGWFPVTTPERKICRKWEHRYPPTALQALYDELKALQSYNLPKDLYSMVINWNNGIFTEPDADGFCYPFLNFIKALREEENDLATLYTETTSFFIWWRLQDAVASLLNSENFLENIMTYRRRLKLIRQIIIASNEYKTEQAKYNERALSKLQLQALQGHGQLSLPIALQSS